MDCLIRDKQCRLMLIRRKASSECKIVLVLGQTPLEFRMNGIGLWLKHHRKICNLTRWSRVVFEPNTTDSGKVAHILSGWLGSRAEAFPDWVCPVLRVKPLVKSGFMLWICCCLPYLFCWKFIMLITFQTALCFTMFEQLTEPCMMDLYCSHPSKCWGEEVIC